MTGTIRTRIEGAIGWLLIDNARRHNAMGLDMWRALPGAVDTLEREDAVRVIIVSGAGEQAFVSGADISEFDTVRASADGNSVYEEIVGGALDRLRRSTLPTIAAIRGFCMGGGLGIALACDLRYARDDARFAIPAARLGVGYTFAMTCDLVRAVGPANAREILYTARHYTAGEAERMGLVNRVLEAPVFSLSVMQTARTMAANAPLSLRTAKQAVAAASAIHGGAQAGEIAALVARCFESEDYAEGRKAFRDKRPPVFRGK